MIFPYGSFIFILVEDQAFVRIFLLSNAYFLLLSTV
jgi:hypothetical protein